MVMATDRFINEGAVKTAQRAPRENKVRKDINGPVVRKNTIGNARRAKRGQSVGLHVTLNKNGSHEGRRAGDLNKLHIVGFRC